MKTVTFRRAHRIWNQGESAGFEDAEADRLIALGIASDPKADAEAQAKADAEAQAKADAEAQAKADAEAQAKGKGKQ